MIVDFILFHNKNMFLQFYKILTKSCQGVMGLVKVNHSFGFCIKMDITVSLLIPLSIILGTMLFRI